MDGQLTYQVQAWNQTRSFHFTFPPHSAIAEVGLAARYDWNEWAVPVANAIAAFTRYTAGDRKIEADGITHAFVANALSEVEGLLIADNCYAGAVLNIFFWPAVR